MGLEATGTEGTATVEKPGGVRSAADAFGGVFRETAAAAAAPIGELRGVTVGGGAAGGQLVDDAPWPANSAGCCNTGVAGTTVVFCGSWKRMLS